MFGLIFVFLNFSICRISAWYTEACTKVVLGSPDAEIEAGLVVVVMVESAVRAVVGAGDFWVEEERDCSISTGFCDGSGDDYAGNGVGDHDHSFEVSTSRSPDDQRGALLRRLVINRFFDISHILGINRILGLGFDLVVQVVGPALFPPVLS